MAIHGYRAKAKFVYVQSVSRHIGIGQGGRRLMGKNDITEHKDQIIERYTGGYPLYLIAKEFGYNPRTVKEYLQKWDIELRGHSKIIGHAQRVFQEHKSEIIERYENGESLKDIANTFGYHASGLSRQMRNWDISVRSMSETASQRLKNELLPIKDELIRRYESGESLTSICENLSCCHTSLGRRFRNWGVQIRKPISQRHVAINKHLETEKDKIIHQYNEGITISIIAEQYGYSYNTIGDRLKSWNIYVRSISEQKGYLPNKNLEANKEEIITRYNNGETYANILKFVRCGKYYLRKKLLEWDCELFINVEQGNKSNHTRFRELQFTQRKQRINDDSSQICKEYIEGITLTKLVDNYKYTRDEIMKVLTKGGIVVRKCLYVAKYFDSCMKFPLYKVGMSNHPYKRRQTIDTFAVSRILKVFDAAGFMEGAVHKKLKRYNYRKEYFYQNIALDMLFSNKVTVHEFLNLDLDELDKPQLELFASD